VTRLQEPIDRRLLAGALFRMCVLTAGVVAAQRCCPLLSPQPAPAPAPAPCTAACSCTCNLHLHPHLRLHLLQAPVGRSSTPRDRLPLEGRALTAGDTLVLAAGTYDDPNDVPGLPIFSLNGTASAPITITGGGDASQTVLLGRSSHNTIRFSNSSYVIVKNLTVDGRDLGGDAVNAQGFSHHIT